MSEATAYYIVLFHAASNLKAHYSVISHIEAHAVGCIFCRR